MGASLFHINADGSLAVMQETPYDSEDHIQALLAQHPEILVGDQFSPDAPRRWALIAREVAVPDSAQGTGRWSLDHLYVDQDGIPTLVEVKREKDTRSRREVIGQMFDYAANGPAYWPIETLIRAFEQTQATRGRDPDEMLAELVGETAASAQFWKTVETNLRAGRIRMVFVADQMPPELLRIVEFLSRQLRDAEIYAVEIRHHAGTSGRVLVTRVMGQLADERAAHDGASPVRPSEDAWLVGFEQRHGADKTRTVRAIIAWMKEHGDEVFTTPAQSPSFGMLNLAGGKKFYPLFLVANGKAVISLGYHVNTLAFASEAQRQEVIHRVNAIDGISVSLKTLLSDIRIPIELLANESRRKAFLAVVGRTISRFKEAAAV